MESVEGPGLLLVDGKALLKLGILEFGFDLNLYKKSKNATYPDWNQFSLSY